MILLGLDVGEKRIGVAKTDELEIMAHAVGFVTRTTDRQAVAEIHHFVLEWNVKVLIVGLPKDLKGRLGPAASKVQAFGDLLKHELPQVELVYWDERLSTRETERILIGLDVSRRKRRKMVDSFAAQSILQNYLDAHRKVDGGHP